MLELLTLILVAIYVFSAIAAFHHWLDHIEQRRIVLTWGRLCFWLWAMASFAWVGPLGFLSLMHGDFTRAPLAALWIIAVYGALPSLAALAIGFAVAAALRAARGGALDFKRRGAGNSYFT